MSKASHLDVPDLSLLCNWLFLFPTVIYNQSHLNIWHQRIRLFSRKEVLDIEGVTWHTPACLHKLSIFFLSFCSDWMKMSWESRTHMMRATFCSQLRANLFEVLQFHLLRFLQWLHTLFHCCFQTLQQFQFSLQSHKKRSLWVHLLLA